MKLRNLALILALLFVSNCFSQETESKFRRHELGFNTTLLIKQVFSFSSINIPFSPYQFTYKYLTKKDVNFRLGAGVATSKTIETQLGVDPRTTKNYFMNYRVGVEKQSIINKHWKCYYGLDITYDYLDTKSDFGSSSIRETSSGFGGGPMFGLQYYINERISLYTETSMIYSDINSKIEETNSFNPSNNQERKTNDVSANIIIPTTLFLAIKF